MNYIVYGLIILALGLSVWNIVRILKSRRK